MSDDAVFWADQLAEQVLETFPDRDTYTCAAGISPSGPVHVGNFREIITVDLVVKALERTGADVRFIYSWDDFDRFRKVPDGVPESFEAHLGKPLSRVPDPDGCHDSYAAHFEAALEDEIAPLGMDIEFIRQHEKFESCAYTDGIRTAMQDRDTIRTILNEHRSEPLPESWYPLRVYCLACGTDFTTVTDYDGDTTIRYHCETCDDEFDLDFSEEGAVKPPWRVDWPMRWDYENIAFEPGGKDHSATGSSRDTGAAIVSTVYGRTPPVYQMYEFVNLKGESGKMSSSSGDVLTPGDLLAVYTPALFRFLFTETKPTRDFSIALDADIVTVYDKFDRIEEAYFDPDSVDNDRKREHWKRVYELSVVEVPDEKPVRVAFDHAAFVAQTVPRSKWREDGIAALRATDHVPEALSREQEDRIVARLDRARNWAAEYAPDDYVYAFNRDVPDDEWESLTAAQQAGVVALRDLLADTDFATSAELEDALFAVARSGEASVGEFFTAAYRCLLSRDDGPRLADFILTRGQDEIVAVLDTVD